MVTSPFRAKLWGLFPSLPEQSFPLITPRRSCRQGCRWESCRAKGFEGSWMMQPPRASPFAVGTMLLLLPSGVWDPACPGAVPGRTWGARGKGWLWGGGQSCRAAACETPALCFQTRFARDESPAGNR